MRLYRILGVTITDEAFEAAADHVRALVDGTGPRSLVFVNAHTLNHAAADPAFRYTLNAASLVFGDGTGGAGPRGCRACLGRSARLPPPRGRTCRSWWPMPTMEPSLL